MQVLNHKREKLLLLKEQTSVLLYACQYSIPLNSRLTFQGLLEANDYACVKPQLQPAGSATGVNGFPARKTAGLVSLCKKHDLKRPRQKTFCQI